MRRKQISRQLPQISMLPDGENNTLNLCQQRLNDEAKSLRKQTELINKQIAKEEDRLADRYKIFQKSTRSKGCAKLTKKIKINHPIVTKSFPPSSLFCEHSQGNSGSSVSKFLLSRIKKFISSCKITASDKLVETMVQKELLSETLNHINVIKYISKLAQQLEPVIHEHDRLLQHLNKKRGTLRRIQKMHCYSRLIRYTMVLIIELIRRARENHCLIPSSLDKGSNVYAIRNMLIHAYPQAARQSSEFSALHIAQVHNRWARQFTALRHLPIFNQENIKSGTLPLKYKFAIPGSKPDLLEQRLWKFYRDSLKRYLYRKSPKHYQVESSRNYIGSILRQNVFGNLTKAQAKQRKLDWCFTIADIGEVIKQCQQLHQNQFHKTLTIRNHVAHANFGAISLQDIQEAVNEINTEERF